MPVTHYKGYTLSDFQIDAIEGILNGENVIVATHTGNGKTLVADYAVNECFNHGLQVIYTAPIKALSNQKYNQFKREFGEANVGLITGDRVINQQAGILVVTTEILRNLMHESPERVENIRFIILDEIHYMNDEERGTVWEEIIIFKRPGMKIIGLSATIPNVGEICDWIESIHREKVKKVFYPERIVRQEHYYFDRALGKATAAEIVQNHRQYVEREGGVPYRNTHLDFMRYAAEARILPVLYFVFSRLRCEEKAQELSSALDLLTDEERMAVAAAVAEHEAAYPEIVRARSWKAIRSAVSRGVGFHHAGLLPIIKQFMEALFESKLVKVLYTTETFAVGINYPVKTVGFDSLRKFDGKTFRNLHGSEYLQMAGRAGRRGIDEVGLVFVLADYKALDNKDFPDIAKMASEPIRSQFGLAYNTVLNLARRFESRELKQFFQRNFANYQYRRSLHQARRAYRALQTRLAQEKEQLLPQRKCGNTDLKTCPAMQERNREDLRALQVLFHRKTTGEKEKEALRLEIEELRRQMGGKPIKCPKTQKRDCTKYFRRLRRREKELQQKGKMLQEEVTRSPEIYFYRNYHQKLELLEALKYISPERELLPRGEVCAHLHIQEVLVTELLFTGLLHDLDEDTLNGVMAGIVFEDEMYENLNYPFHFNLTPVVLALQRIQEQEKQHRLEGTTRFLPSPCGVIRAWSGGEDFFTLTEKAGMPEGDFVALCRRVIDLLRQVRAVTTEDQPLQEKLTQCMRKMDRGIISLGL